MAPAALHPVRGGGILSALGSAGAGAHANHEASAKPPGGAATHKAASGGPSAPSSNPLDSVAENTGTRQPLAVPNRRQPPSINVSASDTGPFTPEAAHMRFTSSPTHGSNAHHIDRADAARVAVAHESAHASSEFGHGEIHRNADHQDHYDDANASDDAFAKTQSFFLPDDGAAAHTPSDHERNKSHLIPSPTPLPVDEIPAELLASSSVASAAAFAPVPRNLTKPLEFDPAFAIRTEADADAEEDDELDALLDDGDDGHSNLESVTPITLSVFDNGGAAEEVVIVGSVPSNQKQGIPSARATNLEDLSVALPTPAGEIDIGSPAASPVAALHSPDQVVVHQSGSSRPTSTARSVSFASLPTHASGDAAAAVSSNVPHPNVPSVSAAAASDRVSVPDSSVPVDGSTDSTSSASSSSSSSSSGRMVSQRRSMQQQSSAATSATVQPLRASKLGREALDLAAQRDTNAHIHQNHHSSQHESTTTGSQPSLIEASTSMPDPRLALQLPNLAPGDAQHEKARIAKARADAKMHKRRQAHGLVCFRFQHAKAIFLD